MAPVRKICYPEGNFRRSERLRHQPEALADSHARLFPHELLDVIRPAGAAARGAAGFPATERVDAGPRARRGAGPAIHVGDACLDAVEKSLNLAIVLGK